MGVREMRGKKGKRFITISRSEFARRKGVTDIGYEVGLIHFAVPLKAGKDAKERIQILSELSAGGVKPMLVKFHPHSLHFAVRSQEKEKALGVLKGKLRFEPTVTDNCCLVAVISSAMRDLPGVMSRIAEVALRLSTDILETSDTRSAVLLLVHEDEAMQFVEALCKAFNVRSPKPLA
jgi:aspartokinase